MCSRSVECFQCGICCELYGGYLHVCDNDIKLWEELGRADLLERVNSSGWIWVDPVTGERQELCPFLTRTDQDHAHCSIHEVKPQMCRRYPTPAHMSRCVRGVGF